MFAQFLLFLKPILNPNIHTLKSQNTQRPMKPNFLLLCAGGIQRSL